MYTKPIRTTRQSMFFDLESQLNQKHLLYLLANKMDWNAFEDVFKDLYFVNNAQVSQTLNCLPYGEDWVDIHSNLDFRLGQYTFNGKEKNSESGFHYYGARYYWSETLTGWLSVDPLADKYPGVSPYAYCMWNPVKLVDPVGEDCRIAVNHKRKTITISANIILYSRSIGTQQLNDIAAQYKKDILETWSKDNNGKVDQRNIDAIFNGRDVSKLDNWRKKVLDHE